MHPAAEGLLTATAIVVPSLLLTLIIRRYFEKVPWRMASTFLLLALLFLWRGIFTTDLPVPVDEAAKGFPYEGVVGRVESRNPLTNDTTRLFLPWMQVIREEFGNGRMPLWNRYSFSGYPLLANGESAPFYPGFLATLIVPLPRQIVAMAGLKIFAALLFTFLLVRREGVSESAAALGAIAFAIGSFQTVYLFYSATAVTSLLPAAVYALLNAMDRPHRRSSLWLIAAVVGTMQTAGHPESVFHAAVGAGGFLAIEAVAPARQRHASLSGSIATIAIGTLGGLLLSAPAWIPVLQQVGISSRIAEIAEAGRHMTPPFPGGAAYALLDPDLFGHPARGTWNWVMNYSIVASSYVGLIPLSLLPSALLARASVLRDRLLCAFAASTFLLAMNWTPIARMLNQIPPLSLVANDKIRFVTCLVVAVCAARVAQRMVRRRGVLDAVWIIGVLLFASFAVISKLETTASWRSAASLVLAIAFAAIAILGRHRIPRFVPAAAAVLTAAQLVLLNTPFNAPSPRHFYKPRLPIIEAIRATQSEEPFRIVGQGWTLMPNASALYGVEDVRGSDPMSSGSYTSFLELFTIAERGMDVERIDDLDHPAIDFLNVKYALAPPSFRGSSSWLEVYRGADGVLLQNAQFAPRFFIPRRVIRRNEEVPVGEQLSILADLRETVVANDADDAHQNEGRVLTRMLSSTHFQLEIEFERPALVASSQPLTPGWKIEVDGEPTPILRVNGAFIGFRLPAGRHRVDVAYAPLAFYGSLPLTFGGIVLLWLAGRFTSGSGR